MSASVIVNMRTPTIAKGCRTGRVEGTKRAPALGTVSPARSNREESTALSNHHAAIRFYVWAISELSVNSETLSSEQFERLRTTVDFARDLYQASK